MHEWEYLATTMGAGPDSTGIGLLTIDSDDCAADDPSLVVRGRRISLRPSGSELVVADRPESIEVMPPSVQDTA
jgi:hypothetical protein